MAAPFGSYNFQTYGYSFMSCKLRVNTSTPGWQRTVRNVLSGIHGVYNFKMDEDGLVQVSGMVDPYVVLNKIGKAGKRAELVWLQYGDCSSYLNMPPPPVPPRTAADFHANDPYADDYYRRGDDPYYAYGARGGYCGGGLGNSGGYSYGGRSGCWNCPRPSYRPFAGLAHRLDPFRRRTSPGWY